MMSKNLFTFTRIEYPNSNPTMNAATALINIPLALKIVSDRYNAFHYTDIMRHYVFVGGKIGLLAALVVSIGGSDHGWPREIDAKVALYRVAVEHLAFCIHNAELDAGQWQGSVSRFGGSDARERGDHNAACFCLPPGINNRAFALADVVVVPMPGFLIDGFAYRAEDFEGT